MQYSSEKNNSEQQPAKRKGRLKKGQVVEASGHKSMTIEEAFKSVEGMKHKIVNKYKVFCNAAVSYEDLISAANLGLIWAYRDWDSKTAKFTTFSHNRMERQIDLYLCEMLPKYKNNVDAKNWLRRKNNESFGNLTALGYTVDEDFNKKHGLNGKKTFTKEHYNLYTQKIANDKFNNGHDLVITNSSGFINDDNEDFDIFSVVTDNAYYIEDDLDYELSNLTDFQAEIAQLILDGYLINDIAKKYGVTKNGLIEMLGIKEEYYENQYK